MKARAVEGRIARISPDGEMIPHDRFVSIPDTHYTRRLLNVHGDIELEPETKPKPKQKSAAKTETADTVDEKSAATGKSQDSDAPATSKGTNDGN